MAGTTHTRAICEKQDQRTYVHGEHGIRDASAVGGSCDDASERLIRDGADVDHRETTVGEDGVESAEGDAGLCDDIALVIVDLLGQR